MTERQARIEAGARALYDDEMRYQGAVEFEGFDDLSDDAAQTYRSAVEVVLAAADAAAAPAKEPMQLEPPGPRFGLDAAAPAVGVTVDEAMVNAAVDAFNAVTQQRLGKSLYGTWWPYDECLPAMKAALEAALLTAQPEPGTHDDAGQPAEGGVTG